VVLQQGKYAETSFLGPEMQPVALDVKQNGFAILRSPQVHGFLGLEPPDTMSSSPDCFICRKHKNLETFTGIAIAESQGWILTHFPFIESEKATKGHLILETKRHITDLTELNDHEAAELGSLMRRGVQQIKSKLGAEHVYIFRINDKVPHLHIHLIPRYPGTPKEYLGFKINEWPERTILDLDQIRAVSRQLAEAD